ncbi:ATP-binding protein [Leekyejoonella antrihumi]|uniref:ATP-binding protein n=1 Tax=Leekyejoonella antrihumi TaxID=1660198 RepID=A0A563DT79_9MICO|nr:ATP-binding protein [Leekyejoonella antrihumi]
MLCGPSGSGKSRLATRLRREHGWPVVALDDFYKDGTDPTLPMITQGLADWDDVRSWHVDRAVAALEEICRTGQTTVPVYDIAASTAGDQITVLAHGAPVVVAEGIFAAHIIAPLRERGLLLDAICVCHPRWITFGRRLARDLREHRKPPHILWTRGLRLTHAEPQLVAAQRALGARVLSPAAAERELAATAYADPV